MAPDLPAEQQSPLDQVFARLPEAVVLTDSDGRVLQVTPPFTLVFGYTREEAVGRHRRRSRDQSLYQGTLCTHRASVP
jgi:PAS domain S-box-containing protein